jgi:hypothetical protein
MLGSRIPDQSFLDGLYLAYCVKCDRFVQRLSDIREANPSREPKHLIVGICEECGGRHDEM